MRMQWVAGLAAVLAGGALAGEALAVTPAAPAVFARVNGKAITVERYEIELAGTIRQKYYHRQPPEDKMRPLRREVGDTLIDRVLLLAEAARRGIKPDQAKIDAGVKAIEVRNKGNPKWEERRQELLPEVRRELAEQSLLERLERAVRDVPKPSRKEAREYYDAHPDLFTEPERLRVSVILVKVDPAAPQADRDKALEEAKGLRKRLDEGADFAALARERSGDASAQKGGDMGYVHRGMLAQPLQEQVDQLKPGMVSEPTAVLEGMAILRLEERQPARLVGFEDSRDRAVHMRQRENAERQWTTLKARLRAAAKIEVVDTSRYPALEPMRK